MGYAALDAIDDAIDATKGFLLPVDRGTWLRLAVVVFFVAGGGGNALNYVQNAQQLSGGGGDFGGDPAATTGAMPDAVGTAVLAVVALALLFVLLLVLVTPIMEFVFVQSLLSREVHVRRYFSGNVGNGFRLLGFQIAVGIAGLVVFGAPLALLLLAGGTVTPAAILGALALAIPLLFLYALVIGTINGFTTVFVVPIMLAEDRGVVAAWRRLWSAIRANLAEFAVYLVLSVILGIGVGIVAGFASLFALLVVGLPIGIVAFGVYSVAGTGTAALAVFAVLGLVFLALFLLVVNLIQVPLQSFLRYYAMLVLGDIDADLDPIPEIRADLRAED